MRMERKSGIEFDFSAALSCSKHDVVNSVWPAVDFVVEEPTRWIWLEVKNWEPAALPPHRRGGRRRSFLSKMKSSVFFAGVLRAKFIGTSRFDSALKLHAMTRMRGLIPRGGPWFVNVEVAVVDLADWNRLFSGYPATVLS